MANESSGDVERGISSAGIASDGNSGNANPNAGNGSGMGDAGNGTGNERDSGNADRIAGIPAFDPNEAEPGRYGYKPDGTPRGKPGRKPGSGAGATPGRKPNSGKANTASSQSVNGLEKLLLSVHMMAAAATKVPEMAIDKSEAAMLANAIAAVQAHYNFDVSEETALWVNLVTAMGSIYGPRAFLVYQRKQKEKAQKPRPVASVSPIKPGNNDGSNGLDIPGMHGPIQ